MTGILLHWVLSTLAFLLAAKLVSGFEVKSWGAAFFGALMLGLVNAIVRPLIVVLTIPLTIITFGLFLFVINALMLKLAAAFVPGISSMRFGTAMLASIVLSLLGVLIRAVI